MAKDDALMDRDGGGKEKTTAQKRGKSSIALILVGLMVMTVTPVATYFVVRNMPGDNGGGLSGRPSARQPIIVDIEPITVNVAGTRMTRVVRVIAHLEINDSRLEPILKAQMPMVRDRIMTTLGRRTMEELEGIDDREALKRDIMLEVNSLIREHMAGQVVGVAFSEFLIQ